MSLWSGLKRKLLGPLWDPKKVFTPDLTKAMFDEGKPTGDLLSVLTHLTKELDKFLSTGDTFCAIAGMEVGRNYLEMLIPKEVLIRLGAGASEDSYFVIGVNVRKEIGVDYGDGGDQLRYLVFERVPGGDIKELQASAERELGFDGLEEEILDAACVRLREPANCLCKPLLLDAATELTTRVVFYVEWRNRVSTCHSSLKWTRSKRNHGEGAANKVWEEVFGQ